jgi:hypothetical protein
MKIERLKGDYKEFEEPISNLLLKCKNFVDMSTSFYPKFYNHEKVKNAIKTCAQKVSRLRILLDKETDIGELKKEVSWIFELKKEYPEIVEIAKAKEDITHHILIDEKYFRIEGKHKRDLSGEPVLRNLIVENPPRTITLQLLHQFNSWWNNSEKVDI